MAITSAAELTSRCIMGTSVGRPYTDNRSAFSPINKSRRYSIGRRDWPLVFYPGANVLTHKPPALGCEACDSLEHRCKMCLVLKSHCQSNLSYRCVSVHQSRLCVLDAVTADKLVGALAGSGSELRSEMHSAQSRGAREAGKRHGRVEMSLDIFGDSLQSPGW